MLRARIHSFLARSGASPEIPKSEESRWLKVSSQARRRKLCQIMPNMPNMPNVPICQICQMCQYAKYAKNAKYAKYAKNAKYAKYAKCANALCGAPTSLDVELALPAKPEIICSICLHYICVYAADRAAWNREIGHAKQVYETVSWSRCKDLVSVQTAKKNPMNCGMLSRSCNNLDARDAWVPPAELVLIGIEDSDRQCLHLGTAASAVWAREKQHDLPRLLSAELFCQHGELAG